MNPDAATVAATLTKAERECIAGDPGRLEASTGTLLCLCLNNLADVHTDNGVFLTPLGLALRHHLEGASDGE